jgi:hypothetical protein
VPSYTARYFLSLGNVAFSLILGVLALAACAIFYQDLTLQLLKWAGGLREWIVSRTNSPQIEIIARFVLHESSILLMFFTLAARVIVGLFVTLIAWGFSGRADPEI